MEFLQNTMAKKPENVNKLISGTLHSVATAQKQNIRSSGNSANDTEKRAGIFTLGRMGLEPYAEDGT